MQISKRLKELRSKYGLTQKELAVKMGMTRGAIGLYEQGKRNVDPRTLQQLAKIFNVSSDYLLGNTTDPRPINMIKEDTTHNHLLRLPIVATISGDKPLNREPVVRYEYINADHLSVGTYFLFEVKDDSLKGSRICKGDLVIIRVQDQVAEGEIAVAKYNDGEAVLRKVYSNNSYTVLQAENPDFPPLILEKDEVRIVGKVVEVRFSVN